jgi:hypothetical protein
MPSPEWRLNRDYFSSSFDSPPVRICFFLSVLCLIKPRPIQLTNRCGGARAIKTAVRILEIWRGSKGCDATPLRKHPPTFIIVYYILYEFYKTLDCDTSWLGHDERSEENECHNVIYFFFSFGSIDLIKAQKYI